MKNPDSPRVPLGTIVAATAAISLITSLGYGFAAAAIADSRGSNQRITQIATNMPSDGGGAHTMNYDYTGTYSGTKTANGSNETVENTTVKATAADTNALLAEDGGTLTASKITAVKAGDSTNADNTNFYGTNAISLTVGEKSTTVLDDSTLQSDAEGANAIFATDSGTVLTKDIKITTSADNSRALDATYNGTIIAGDLTASTQGNHSATIATDRGGGNISVDEAELSTAGSGSPLIYSTGNIQVHDVTGTASGSQIAGMEGMNTILISDSKLSSTITGKTASDPVANGIIIYQSTSGDAEASTGERATFQAVDSTLSSKIEEGAMFYTTNTSADIVLEKTKLDFDSSKAALLTAAGNNSNNWGQQGSNGANITFTGREETLSGDVNVDSISSVTMNLLDTTSWTGAVNLDADGDATGTMIVNIDGSSTWNITKNTTISELHVAQGGKVVDTEGKTVTIVADGSTVVQGDSDLTLTVTGEFSTTVNAGDETQLSTDLIDRKDFDTKFDTDSTWTMQ